MARNLKNSHEELKNYQIEENIKKKFAHFEGKA